MSFVGLDLSLRATGLALVSPDDVTASKITTLSPPPALKETPRLKWIQSALAQALAGTDITHAAIEGYSFGSKNNQFYLGELGGVIRLWLYTQGIPYIVVPPNVLKKWTTGNGAADKIVMAVSTFDEWGFRFEDDNQCDAFNLAVMAAAYADTPLAQSNADRKRILEVVRANPLGLPKGKAK